VKPIAYLVAPYHPAGGELVNLGAARKIECVVRLLAQLGFRVRLINSGHDRVGWGSATRLRRSVGGQRLVELRPFTLPNRPIGKLANAIHAHFLAGALAAHGRESLVWIYNGYAFECLFALAFRHPLRLVLELEDLPSARPRGFRRWQLRVERGLLDAVLTRVQLVTCVNRSIATRVGVGARRSLLLPGVIVDSWRAAAPPVPFTSAAMRIGYFGGLSVEKGAVCLLELLKVLPEAWCLVVTGSGELAGEFRSAARADRRMEFHECVADTTLRQLMWSCDVLVNPHQSIQAMDDGVFPFKMYEYLSTGRLVVTTPLPDSGLELGNAMVTFDGTAAGLHACLLSAPRLFTQRAQQIGQLAQQINREFSEAAVASRVREALQLASVATPAMRRRAT